LPLHEDLNVARDHEMPEAPLLVSSCRSTRKLKEGTTVVVTNGCFVTGPAGNPVHLGVAGGYSVTVDARGLVSRVVRMPEPNWCPNGCDGCTCERGGRRICPHCENKHVEAD